MTTVISEGNPCDNKDSQARMSSVKNTHAGILRESSCQSKVNIHACMHDLNSKHIRLATKMLWLVSIYYPVEEFLKFLHEQLHSASLHCSGKGAIEELQHEENEHC